MLMHCFCCGVEKDTEVYELNTQDDSLIQDQPIPPLFVLECARTISASVTDWRITIVCHGCYFRLQPDMWISDSMWTAAKPKLVFEDLPREIENAVKWEPTVYAYVNVPL